MYCTVVLSQTWTVLSVSGSIIRSTKELLSYLFLLVYVDAPYEDRDAPFDDRNARSDRDPRGSQETLEMKGMYLICQRENDFLFFRTRVTGVDTDCIKTFFVPI